jgi:hypothetical protein
VPDVNHVPDEVLQHLDQVPTQNQRLKRQDFTLTDGTSGERSKIASYQPKVPLALRQDTDMRLVIVAAEEFTHSGGGSTDTFNLSQNIVNSPTSTALVLYDDGDIVQPDSVDYGGDSFDYTDNDTSTLHALYVARDASVLEIEKSAPRSQGNVTEVVFDEPTAILAERLQQRLLGPVIVALSDGHLGRDDGPRRVLGLRTHGPENTPVESSQFGHSSRGIPPGVDVRRRRVAQRGQKRLTAHTPPGRDRRQDTLVQDPRLASRSRRRPGRRPRRRSRS